MLTRKNMHSIEVPPVGRPEGTWFSSGGCLCFLPPVKDLYNGIVGIATDDFPPYALGLPSEIESSFLIPAWSEVNGSNRFAISSIMTAAGVQYDAAGHYPRFHMTARQPYTNGFEAQAFGNVNQSPTGKPISDLLHIVACPHGAFNLAGPYVTTSSWELGMKPMSEDFQAERKYNGAATEDYEPYGTGSTRCGVNVPPVRSGFDYTDMQFSFTDYNPKAAYDKKLANSGQAAWDAEVAALPHKVLWETWPEKLGHPPANGGNNFNSSSGNGGFFIYPWRNGFNVPPVNPNFDFTDDSASADDCYFIMMFRGGTTNGYYRLEMISSLWLGVWVIEIPPVSGGHYGSFFNCPFARDYNHDGSWTGYVTGDTAENWADIGQRQAELWMNNTEKRILPELMYEAGQ